MSDGWASWKWLATTDERVLWALLLSAAALAMWGGWSGYRMSPKKTAKRAADLTNHRPPDNPADGPPNNPADGPPNNPPDNPPAGRT